MEIPLFLMQAGPVDVELARQPPTGSRRLTYEGSYDVVGTGRALAAVLLQRGFLGSRLDWECSPELHAKETAAIVGNQLVDVVRVREPHYVDQLDEAGWEEVPTDDHGYADNTTASIPGISELHLPLDAVKADAHVARQRAIRRLRTLRLRQASLAKTITKGWAGPMLVISSYPELTQQLLGLCYDPPMSAEDAAELPVTPGELFELTDDGAGVVSIYKPPNSVMSSVNIRRPRGADAGPPELWVVRHAQDRLSAQGRLNGHSEHGLTALGRLQTLAVAAWMLDYATERGLWITSGTSSPLTRTINTFDDINQRLGRWSRLRDCFNDNLRERGAGLSTYRTTEEIAALAQDHNLQSLPGLPDYYEGFLDDEPYAEVYDRASKEMERLWRRQQMLGGVGIVVTHSMVMRMAIGYWNGMKREEVPRILQGPSVHNGEVIRFREVNGRRERATSLFWPTDEAIENYYPCALRMLQEGVPWAW